MSTLALDTLSDLAREIAASATLEGEFVLRSGQISHRYFDKYLFEGLPYLLKPLARAMADLLPAETDIIAGLELGGVPLATAISLETGLPTAFVRKKPKEYGTRRTVEGPDLAGKRVTFIEDIVSTGGAVADAYAHASELEADILAVVCAIWRGDGQPTLAGAPSLPVLPLFVREDIERFC